MSADPTTAAPPANPLQRMFSIFAPAPAQPVRITDPAEVRAQHRYWQRRILISSIIGYAAFYFVRKNLSIAMPVMEKNLGISKAELGIFLTLHGVLYGVSKFVNGFIGDRANARTFMAAGLILSALTNVVFGASSAVVVLGSVWMLNGWFQGMGFPPCARLMTHWIPPRELATKMSIWNTSHSIGAGLVVVMCGYLAQISWRLCFFVPSVIAIACAIMLLLTLRDTPQSLGLPEVEGTEEKHSRAKPPDFMGVLVRHVFSNPYIWLLALANFFVYTVRFAVLDWGPTLLTQAKGFQLTSAGWVVAAFELFGLLGMLASGWLTDKIFGGRGARTCFFSMLMTAVFLALFWKLPHQSKEMSTALLCATGFFIYGPQALVGITVANLATKQAAASAIGLTGLFAYASTILSGWGLGLLVQHKGWDIGLGSLIIVAAIGTTLFAIAWPAKANGYGD